MIDQMRWAGDSLAWIEDTDLRTDGREIGFYFPDYYAGTRLMVLEAAATKARAIPGFPIGLEADLTGVTWEGNFVPGLDLWHAGGPSWLPVQLAVPSTGWLRGVSNGWVGWTEPIDRYAVMRPQDSVPHIIPDGFYLSGGWLFLSKWDESTALYGGLEAVRIADLG